MIPMREMISGKERKRDRDWNGKSKSHDPKGNLTLDELVKKDGKKDNNFRGCGKDGGKDDKLAS